MCGNSALETLLSAGVVAAFISSVATLFAQLSANSSQKSLAQRNARRDYLRSALEALRVLRAAATIPYPLSSGLRMLANGDDMAQPIEFLVEVRDWFLRAKAEYENARHYLAETDRSSMDASLDRVMTVPFQSFERLSLQLEDEPDNCSVSADLIPQIVDAVHGIQAFTGQAICRIDATLARTSEELSRK